MVVGFVVVVGLLLGGVAFFIDEDALPDLRFGSGPAASDPTTESSVAGAGDDSGGGDTSAEPVVSDPAEKPSSMDSSAVSDSARSEEAAPAKEAAPEKEAAPVKEAAPEKEAAPAEDPIYAVGFWASKTRLSSSSSLSAVATVKYPPTGGCDVKFWFEPDDELQPLKSLGLGTYSRTNEKGHKIYQRSVPGSSLTAGAGRLYAKAVCGGKKKSSRGWKVTRD